ncbi:MAG: TonB-dependent receptor [Chitinophagales bacterium]|nr:TonB-dependent receptor [Chitinophagales bacterium]
MKKLYVLLCSIMFIGGIFAQSVTGLVTDEKGEPLFGVNVVEKGTYNGTTTDFNGKYTLELTRENPVIVFKFVGYRDQEYTYSGGPINHQMKIDEIGLDAVIVTASKKQERVLDAPASVTLINSSKIENTAAVVATDNLKSVPGVDIMPTGLVSSNVSVRGFNGIFSGSMLTMVDYRFGRVPSLNVNAFQLMPSSNEDIERIEVVRGPGSALYGPNASDGVMHIITKSPLSMSGDHNAETSISFTGGSRSVWAPSVRHSQKINDKIGFKVSGGYMQGHDFEYQDPREPGYGQPYYFGTVLNGTEFVVDSAQGLQSSGRNFFIQKYNFDARVDYAVTKDIDFTFSSGYANTTNLELTGLGAAQGVGWGYTYGQFRARWKNLFFNYFINASNSGDTYFIPQVSDGDAVPYNYQTLVDKSKLHGIQIQHNSKIRDLFDFTYGFDAILTRPFSEGTIYGRYEEDDNINQYGIYGQAEWHINKKVDFLAALRGDYQDRIKEFMVSPRAAFVYKPSPRHTLRLTYNRAFSSPSALTTALDLPSTFIPNGMIGRGLGNPSGFSYNYGVDGFAQFRTPTSYGNTGGNWYSVGDNSQNYLLFQDVTESIGRVLGTALAGSEDLGVQLISAITQGLVDANSPVNDVNLVVTDFITNKQYDYKQITDLESVKSTVTQTVEMGYKGIIKDKLFLSADLYYTQINNFISPLSPASYRVQFDPAQLSGAIAAQINANLQSVSSFGITYNELLSGGFSSSLNLDANGDGSVFEEIMGLLAGNPNDPSFNGYIYDFSVGTLAPESDLVNSDLILTYLNLGKVDVAGADLGATYVEKFGETDFTVSGMFSFVNKDRIALAGASDGYIALNAPKYKTALSVEAGNIANTGIGAGINWRWQDAFPANSALYVGNVSAANLIDLSLSYRPSFSKNTLLSGSFYNITNNKFQRFPGTPYIGFYAMFKVSHTFKYNIGKNKHAAE